MTSDPLHPFKQAEAQRLANRNAWTALGAPPSDRGIVSAQAAAAAKAEISAWPGYRPTPLRALPGLAGAAGLGEIHYKDEAERFGLGSFKALGGAYAVLRLLLDHLRDRHGIEADGASLRGGQYRDLTAGVTVASATDGNHGRSVAWGARLFGCRCVIYIHQEVSQGREQALAGQGAEVVRVAGNYDHAVARCAEDAALNGWAVVSDTSWTGYREVPRHVMAGYSVMVSEIIDQLDQQPPTHVFVQAGVGGIAATIAELFARTWQGARPRFVVVEPGRAPCLYASAEAGRPRRVEIAEETLMAGLSCGEVSQLAWEVLSGAADDFMTIGEDLVAPAMGLLAAGPFGDAALVAGESAVAGLAAALVAALSPGLRQDLGLSQESRVLVIGTEGATDPAIYQALTGRAPVQVAAQIAA